MIEFIGRVDSKVLLVERSTTGSIMRLVNATTFEGDNSSNITTITVDAPLSMKTRVGVNDEEYFATVKDENNFQLIKINGLTMENVGTFPNSQGAGKAIFFSTSRDGN